MNWGYRIIRRSSIALNQELRRIRIPDNPEIERAPFPGKMPFRRTTCTIVKFGCTRESMAMRRPIRKLDLPLREGFLQVSNDPGLGIALAIFAYRQ